MSLAHPYPRLTTPPASPSSGPDASTTLAVLAAADLTREVRADRLRFKAIRHDARAARDRKAKATPIAPVALGRPAVSAKAKYRGVALLPDGQWRAWTYFDHGRQDRGTFGTAEEAARAYDAAAFGRFGYAATLNFGGPDASDAGAVDRGAA